MNTSIPLWFLLLQLAAFFALAVGYFYLWGAFNGLNATFRRLLDSVIAERADRAAHHQEEPRIYRGGPIAPGETVNLGTIEFEIKTAEPPKAPAKGETPS